MRKMKNLLNRIPRPLKACVCWVLVIVLAAAYYIALGCPSLTLRQEMRRAERAHMVGPSKIVDRLDHGQYDEFSRLLVGETEEGIVFFGKYFTNTSQTGPFDDYAYRFHYLPKTGDISFFAAPNIYGHAWVYQNQVLPVYVFTEQEDAVRAEIKVKVDSMYKPNSFNFQTEILLFATMQAESIRSDDGPFRFILVASREAEAQALSILSYVSTDKTWLPDHQKDAEVEVTVLLYDSNDTLIREEKLILNAPLGDN